MIVGSEGRSHGRESLSEAEGQGADRIREDGAVPSLLEMEFVLRHWILKCGH